MQKHYLAMHLAEEFIVKKIFLPDQVNMVGVDTVDNITMTTGDVSNQPNVIEKISNSYQYNFCM